MPEEGSMLYKVVPLLCKAICFLYSVTFSAFTKSEDKNSTGNFPGAITFLGKHDIFFFPQSKGRYIKPR